MISGILQQQQQQQHLVDEVQVEEEEGHCRGVQDKFVLREGFLAWSQKGGEALTHEVLLHLRVFRAFIDFIQGRVRSRDSACSKYRSPSFVVGKNGGKTQMKKRGKRKRWLKKKQEVKKKWRMKRSKQV
jgi:hypothetical protein